MAFLRNPPPVIPEAVIGSQLPHPSLRRSACSATKYNVYSHSSTSERVARAMSSCGLHLHVGVVTPTNFGTDRNMGASGGATHFFKQPNAKPVPASAITPEVNSATDLLQHQDHTILRTLYNTVKYVVMGGNNTISR